MTRTEAEELAIALEYDVASVGDAIASAERKLVTSAEPGPELIDIAMASRHPAAVVAGLLRSLPGEPDIARATRGVLARMRDAVLARRTSPRSVASHLYAMALRGLAPDAEAARDMLRLDDSFALAEGAVIAVEEAERELLELLRANARERRDA